MCSCRMVGYYGSSIFKVVREVFENIFLFKYLAFFCNMFSSRVFFIFENCVELILITYSSSSSRSTPFLTHPFFSFPTIRSIYSWMYGLPQECGYLTRGNTLRNIDSSFPSSYCLTLTPQLGVGIHIQLPSAC